LNPQHQAWPAAVTPQLCAPFMAIPASVSPLTALGL
jgi:hypothetical protein